MKVLSLAVASLFLFFSGQEKAVNHEKASPAMVLRGPAQFHYQTQLRTGPTVIGTGTDQSLLFDEFGDLTVTWFGGPDSANPALNTVVLSRSQNYGASWSAPLTLPITGLISNFPFGPTTAVERNGAIDIVYTCEEAGAQTCPGNAVDVAVLLIRSIDGGKTWSSPTNVSLPPIQEGSGASGPVIMACGAGIVLAWQDDGFNGVDEHSSEEILLRYIVGGVAQPAIDVTANEVRPPLTVVNNGHPQIAVSPQSNVFVSWVYDNGGTAPWSIMFAEIPNCGELK